MMTDPRSALPPASAVQLAIAAAARQGEHGAVSALARQHGVHRQRVRDLRELALEAVTAALEPTPKAEGWRQSLEVYEAEIARVVIALRVMMPASLRDIVDVLRVVYGVGWGYGKIQRLLAKAAEHAAKWLADVRLDKVKAVALDEMFSQGEPVMAGIELTSGAMALSAASATPSTSPCSRSCASRAAGWSHSSRFRTPRRVPRRVEPARISMGATSGLISCQRCISAA